MEMNLERSRKRFERASGKESLEGYHIGFQMNQFDSGGIVDG